MTAKELIFMTPCAFDFSEDCAIQLLDDATAHYRLNQEGKVLRGGDLVEESSEEILNRQVRFIEWEKDYLLIYI